MPVIHNKDLVFLHIPKSGGMSVMNSHDLYDDLNVDLVHGKNEHLTPDEIIGKGFYQEFDSYKKLVITRHPAERLISAFKYLRRKERTNKYAKYGSMTWRDFLESRPWLNPKAHEPHWFWTPQSEYVKVDGVLQPFGKSGDGKWIWSKCEMIFSKSNHWEKISQLAFGDVKPLPHNNGTGERMHYHHYFGDRFSDEIKDFYKEDFDLFNYQWEKQHRRLMWTWAGNQYLINKKSEPLKLKSVLTQLDEAGLSPWVYEAFVPSIRDNKYRGRVGCTKSHANCLRESQKSSSKPTIILEDDCKWIGDRIQLAFAIDEARSHGFETLWLGNLFGDHRGASFDIKRCGSNIWSGKGLRATHAMIYSKQAGEKFLSVAGGDESELLKLHKSGFRMDCWLGNNTKCLGVHPMAFVQSHHKSSTCTTQKNYEAMGLKCADLIARHFGVQSPAEKMVSVVMKTFGRPSTAIKTIESIRLYYPNIEIVLVDDSEKSKLINHDHISRLKVKYVQTDYDIGLGEGRNVGVSNASNDFVYMTDDDHIMFYESDLDLMLRMLRNSSVDVLCGARIEGQGKKGGSIVGPSKSKDKLHWYGCFDGFDLENRLIAKMFQTRGFDYDGVLLVDYGPNVSMYNRVSVPVKHSKMKSREHLFWFRSLATGGFTVGYTDKFCVFNTGINKLDKADKKEYYSGRNRKDNDKVWSENFVFSRPVKVTTTKEDK